MPITLLVLKPGVLSPQSRAQAEALGMFVVETSEPGSVRLVRAMDAEITGSVMLECAMQALNSGMFANEQRETFTKLLDAAMRKAKEA